MHKASIVDAVVSKYKIVENLSAELQTKIEQFETLKVSMNSKVDHMGSQMADFDKKVMNFEVEINDIVNKMYMVNEL